ncbi:hypothetical protein CKO25_05960 [Thiocapsa imhoffii]|uniref:Uncharacterized protein n=1 Tax=Thiocapsa imhoffii TaxID=382777 RepID=A0A9X0WGB4_9GAMM|nr:hypothetical protein [Thiocapsa imhoffii]MBK1644204.1 hypothetical protein [Thiocapsa imhoffii]
MTPAPTLLDALVSQLIDASKVNDSVQVKPAAVLWPDATGEWTAAQTAVRQRLPGLVTLGAYRPQDGQGPAIWIKCAVAGAFHVDASEPQPLVVALGHLAEVAERGRHLPSGSDPDQLARSYLEGGWRVDAAALRALGVVQTKADLDAVSAALRAPSICPGSRSPPRGCRLPSWPRADSAQAASSRTGCRTPRKRPMGSARSLSTVCVTTWRSPSRSGWPHSVRRRWRRAGPACRR